ncbi:MAG: hypothetical protein N2652_01165 [Kiritimatiellae bacterium]|nr:hypothetical protein [Kiritimatiellia bacterium]
MHKELTGVEFFDTATGGVYAGRCWLLCGPTGSGKSAISLQFLAQGIRSGQRALLLSSRPAADSAIWAAAYGSDVEAAIESGELTLLEYSHYVPGRNSESSLMLPSEGFLELQDIIETQAVRRMAIDTIVPWVAAAQPELVAEHVFSFVRAFERLRCTTLLTLPRPVSPAACRIKNALDDVVPISVTLSLDPRSGQRTWTTSKYLGASRGTPPTAYVLVAGRGAVEGVEPEPPPAAEVAAPAATAPAEAPAAPAISPSPSPRVRFSQVVLGEQGKPETGPSRGFRFGITLGK